MPEACQIGDCAELTIYRCRTCARYCCLEHSYVRQEPQCHHKQHGDYCLPCYEPTLRAAEFKAEGMVRERFEFSRENAPAVRDRYSEITTLALSLVHLDSPESIAHAVVIPKRRIFGRYSTVRIESGLRFWVVGEFVWRARFGTPGDRFTEYSSSVQQRETETVVWQNGQVTRSGFPDPRWITAGPPDMHFFLPEFDAHSQIRNPDIALPVIVKNLESILSRYQP